MTDWSEEHPTIELVKATVTVPEVAELLGLEPNSQDKIPSPWNQDENTPSCHLYEDHFWCFSTGKGGDVIDLVRAFYPDMTVNDVVRKIWFKALRCGLEPGHVEATPVRTLHDFGYEFEQHPGTGAMLAARDWWNDTLGLTIPENVRFDVSQGFPPPLLIPHMDADGVYGVKIRSNRGEKSSWPGSQFTKRLYHPGGWTTTAVDADVVITEGESDCWSLKAALDQRVLVLALPSGAQSWKDSWLDSDLSGARKVYICMDNDRAGVNARDKLTSKIGYLKAEQLRVPELYNDAREAIAAGWKPTL